MHPFDGKVAFFKPKNLNSDKISTQVHFIHLQINPLLVFLQYKTSKLSGLTQDWWVPSTAQQPLSGEEGIQRGPQCPPEVEVEQRTEENCTKWYWYGSRGNSGEKQVESITTNQC